MMSEWIRARAKQFIYLAMLLMGAAFVLAYRGVGWTFVRGYMGDWLVVQFIYGIVRLVIGYRWRYALAAGIFAFALGVEVVQLIAAGSIPHTFAMEVTIGSTFDPGDVAVYGVGIVTALMTERVWKPEKERI